MSLSVNLKRYVASVVATSAVVFSAQSMAGAFQLWEEDASDTGNYHAGAAAEADRAGTEYYNPAGMTRLKHQKVSAGGALIALNARYSGTASGVLGGFIPFSLAVPNAAADTTNIVPDFHYVLPFADHWAFGFGITSPFGLETKYANVSNVNLLATKTQLATVNLNPSIAYQVNHYLSFAVGFDELYGQAVYESNPVPAPLQLQQYTISSKLDGWDCGYNAGMLVQFTPTTRAGISYRSAITVDAKGSSTSSTFSFISPQLINAASTASFPLPATTIFSLYHDVNSRLSFMGSAFYTQWDVFKELVINNLATPGGIGTIAVRENYHNTWNFSVGGRYALLNNLWLDAGFGHDETPTVEGYRDIRLPDNNRYAASVGIDLKPSPGFMWSMGWTHFFIPASKINNSLSNDPAQTTPGLQPPVALGTELGDVDVLGMQFSVDIDRS